MATYTQGQIEAKGFTLVANGADRYQRWSGAVNGRSFEIMWDSSTQRVFRIPDADDSVANFRAMLTLGVSLSTVVAAIPLSVLDNATKNSIQAALASALQDITLP